MIQVYLIRHSITKGNLEGRYIGSTDEALCESGIILAQSKKMPAVQKVYTSPLVRCIETAKIIYPNVSRAIIPSLRETDFGDFEYKNYEELNGNEAYQKWIDSNGKSGFPNGETFEEAYSRALEAFRTVIKDASSHNYKSIAIVTHGGTIMSIMETLSNEKKDYFEWHVKNCEGYMLEIDGG
jgi:alpha-ribazole phosphatase